MKGRYRFITSDHATGKEAVSPWINNLIMEGAINGTGLIMRQLANDTTYALPITSAAIGTGSTAPALSDTALVAPVLSGILVRSRVQTPTSLTLKFFVTDGELANGTYREFGLFCGARLFARSLISPVWTKATGQDAIIEYVITIT